MKDVALRLRGIRHAYARREPVLRGVDLEVPRGALTVLMGPNGSGKTTLLRIAAGLVRPADGSATTGDGVAAHVASRRGRIGYIPQQLGLVRSATALDNVLLGGLREVPGLVSMLGLVPPSTRDRAEEALAHVGLSHKADRRVKDLSGGERQRVAIARTLLQGADVIVADELVASLDALQAQAVMEIQQDLARKGIAILLALHQIDLALANADQICFLQDGRITTPRAPGGLTAEEARCALLP